MTTNTQKKREKERKKNEAHFLIAVNGGKETTWETEVNNAPDKPSGPTILQCSGDADIQK